MGTTTLPRLDRHPGERRFSRQALQTEAQTTPRSEGQEKRVTDPQNAVVEPTHLADASPQAILRKMISHFRDHRVILGKFTRLQLGIDQLAVQRELKTAATGGFQLQAGDLLLVLCQNLGRQTDGPRLVISSRAVSEMHFHGLGLSWSFQRVD